MNFIRMRAAALGAGRTERDLLIAVDGVIDIQTVANNIKIIYDTVFLTNNAAQTIYTNIVISSYTPTANDKANLIAAIEESVKAPNSIPYFKVEDDTKKATYAYAANIDKPV